MAVIDVLLRRLRARVDGMIARAVIARVNDALKVQRLQLSIRDADEVADETEHFQPYGLSFVPPEGAEALALALGGDRSHTVTICAQHPEKRPKGSPAGTGGLYTEGEWRVFIDADGVVHIGAQAGAEFIALAEKTDARITSLQERIDDLDSRYQGHQHLVSTTGTAAAQTGTAAPITDPPAVPLGAQESVAATKAKAT